MSRKAKYIQAVPIIFLLVIGLFGCSGNDETQLGAETETPVQQQEQTQDQAEIETPTQTNAADTEEEEAVTVKDEGEKGFATSEEAVLAFLAGLRDNDFGYIENTFFDKSRAADISSLYVYFCEIDLIPELENESYVKLSEDGDAEKFLEQLAEKIEKTDFDSMEFLGFVSLDLLFDSNDMEEAYQRILDMTAKDNGGSELQSHMVAIQINGKKYLLVFDTIKADDRWYVFQLGGTLPSFMGDEVDDMMDRLEPEEEEILEAILIDGTDTLELPEYVADKVERERIESEGFDTPEEAVSAYLEGLKACDTERMLSTFSVESYGQNYNMQAYLEHMQAYMFLEQEVTVPAINDFTKAMISCEREKQLSEDMLDQGNALYLWNCYYNDTEPEQGVTYTWEELQEKLELDSIEVVEFILPETIAEKSGSEQVNAIRDRNAGICGADQQQDCVAIFTCGGEKYCLFMEEMQYNGRWYNSNFGNYAFSELGGYSYTMGTLPFEALEYIE